MPSGWNILSSSPDTYSNDGGYGLSPSVLGNFSGVTAYEGIRWVAGASFLRTDNDPIYGSSESFGTQLSDRLVPQASYSLTGYLYQALRTDLDNPGGYQIFLSSQSTSSQFLVGTIGPTSRQNTWIESSINFLAPSNAADFDSIIFSPYSSNPGTNTYPGLDALTLSRRQVQPPPTGEGVPGPLPALGAAAAFGYSRKLRERIARNKLVAVARAID